SRQPKYNRRNNPDGNHHDEKHDQQADKTPEESSTGLEEFRGAQFGFSAISGQNTASHEQYENKEYKCGPNHDRSRQNKDDIRPENQFELAKHIEAMIERVRGRAMVQD